MEFGEKTVRYKVLDSTNIKAKELAKEGAKEGTLVLANKQTAGKGRRGRTWISEEDTGIYMSIILRPAIPVERVSAITLVMALAITDAVVKIADCDVKIKWPNDIVINGKKVCGILTEMSSVNNAIEYVIVGMGVNLSQKSFPEELQNIATSIWKETKKKVSKEQVIASILFHAQKRYYEFQQAGSLSPFVEEYNHYLVNCNERVVVYKGIPGVEKTEVSCAGTARGIDETGALLVETEDGICPVISGEVSVRGIYGYV